MKKKRFYNNKKRNSKWTEHVKGRKIDFADKYIDAGTGSDKYDGRRPRARKKYFTRQRLENAVKNTIIFVCCFLIVSVGYTAMDLYMERRSMPVEQKTEQHEILLKDVKYDVRGMFAQSLSIDGGVMLSAVIDEAQQGGYSAIVFDAKRNDGTIGYDSKLATIGAYGAISSAASNVEKSMTTIGENDLLPIARISCYKDNVVPSIDLNSAVLNGKKPYTDYRGNTYLNPNSDSAYEYIKGIIEELKGLGVNVFLLDNYTLPEDITNDYYDGFDSISKLLYANFNNEIKLLAAVNVELESEDNDELKEEIKEKIEKTNSVDKVYFITTDKPDRVKSILDKNSISNYVIKQ